MPREGTAWRDPAAPHPGVDRVPALDIRLTFDAAPLVVRAALVSIRGALTPFALRPAELDTIELVLAEVFNNIVEHALAGRDDGVISLRARRLAHGLAVEVMDNGTAMPAGTLPEGRCPDATVPMDALPEGGFGWYMIRSLTDDLAYRSAHGRNRLTFRIAADRDVAAHPFA